MTTVDPLSLDGFPDPAPARPIWLVTLADLALLLVGFFVLLQANQSVDRGAMTRAFRQTFGRQTFGATVQPNPAPLPLAAASMPGFAPGSSALPQDTDALINWARGVTRDPRTVLTITGSVDGSTADVDPATGSGAILATDRARAVAAALATALPHVRLSMTTAADTPGPHPRSVLVSLGFAGVRQAAPANPVR